MPFKPNQEQKTRKGRGLCIAHYLKENHGRWAIFKLGETAPSKSGVKRIRAENASLKSNLKFERKLQYQIKQKRT